MTDWLRDYAEIIARGLIIGAVLGLITALMLGY
jgi:hypothetical protein